MGNEKGVPIEFPADYIPSFLKQPAFNEDTENGLCIQNKYIPEEIIIHILSFIDPKSLLKYSLVCKKWNSLIKSSPIWSIMYNRMYKKKAKLLPWYLYYCLMSTNYFKNLLKNCNGEEEFSHWTIEYNGGDRFIIENPPVGASSLPFDDEMEDRMGCFATSYQTCSKKQSVIFKNRLFSHIFNKYKPHIYASEWVAGRFDCGSKYKMTVSLIGKDTNIVGQAEKEFTVEQWQGGEWSKVELLIENFSEDVTGITFEHMGRDTQFWKGHYGSKMAGATLKVLFDSIKPLDDNESNSYNEDSGE